ncbi:uncharacterized protein [Apostichopus japonicus]
MSSPIPAVLEEHLGVRIVAFIGTVTTPIAFYLSSLVNSIPSLYLTFGIMYGLSSCFVLHSTLRMFYSIYNERNGQRAVTLILIGEFAAAAAGNGTIQSLLVRKGWRITMQYIAAMTAAVIPLPLIFYQNGRKSLPQFPTAGTKPPNSLSNASFNQEVPPESYSNPSFESTTEDETVENNGGPPGVENCSSSGDAMKQGKISERLKSFISRTDTWLVSLSYFFTFSALSIYQVNMVSHFESLESLTLDDVWLIMTVTNVSDVVTRIFVMVTGGNFLYRPVYVIIGTNIVLSLVSFSYSVLVSVWPLVTISLCLGFARSTTVVMSWNMVVNLIGSQYADYVVTLVMYLQGFSYLVGTLPPGAIFDATGSYDLAFKIISLSFFMAAAILIFLAIRSSRRIREKRLSIEKESTETKTPRVSLVSYSTNMT